MIGSRYFDTGGNGTYNFMKVDGNQLQYYTTYNGGSSFALNLINADNQWHYYTIAKTDATVTTYRDGLKIGNATTNGSLSSTKFGLGGDPYNINELWYGSFDDVSISSASLTESQVKSNYLAIKQSYRDAVLPKSAAASNAARPITILDVFNVDNQSIATSASITANSTWQGTGIQWKVLNKGLESTGVSDIAASVSDGRLVISGTATGGAPWRGITLQTPESYTASADNIVLFSIDKISLSRTGDAARASIWMFEYSSTDKTDGSNYVHFSQNTEQSNYFTFNDTNPATTTPNAGTGTDTKYVTTLDAVNTMTLKHDGTNVWMYVDGRAVGCTEANFDTFTLMVSGMSRAYNGGANTVNAVFDNAALTIIKPSTWQTPSIEVVDSFDSDSSLADWTTKGTVSVQETLNSVNVGLLNIDNTGQAVYKTPYLFTRDFSMRVERESMVSGLTSGGLLVESTAGDMLRVLQSGNGSWGLEWEDLEVTNLQYLPAEGEAEELVINDGSAFLYAGDLFTTQILLDSTAPGTGNGLFDLYLNDRHFQFEVSGLEGNFQAALFGTGTDARISFNNFGLQGQEVPEPATWLAFLMGCFGLMFWRSRQSNVQTGTGN